MTLYGDKVFVAASEAVLVSFDAKTDREVWSTTVADYQAGYHFSLAPLVARWKAHGGHKKWRVRHPPPARPPGVPAGRAVWVFALE